MLPWKELLVSCPFCKSEKSLMQLLSTNNFGWSQWSDTKTTYMHEVFPVQKCESCWKYYFWYDQESREWDDITLNTWDLYYPEAKEAVEQLYSEELDEDHIYRLLISFLWAYNNWFFRENDDDKNKKVETEEDIKFFNKFIEKLCKIIPEENVMFKSELLREMWKFDECIELLNKVNLWNVEFVKRQIIEHAEAHDKNVFCISR